MELPYDNYTDSYVGKHYGFENMAAAAKKKYKLHSSPSMKPPDAADFKRKLDIINSSSRQEAGSKENNPVVSRQVGKMFSSRKVSHSSSR